MTRLRDTARALYIGLAGFVASVGAFALLWVAIWLVYETTGLSMVPMDPGGANEPEPSAPSTLETLQFAAPLIACGLVALAGVLSVTDNKFPARKLTMSLAVPLTLIPVVYFVGIVALDWPPLGG